MRVYITPERLNKFNADLPDTCYRCGKDKGTLFHCLWTCPKVKEFWEEVKGELQKILAINIELDPKLFLLGLYPTGHKIKRSEQIFLDFGLLQAKRVIALSWKSIRKPSISQWFKELTTSLPLERITYTLKNKQELFEKIWGHFIQYVKSNDLSHLTNVMENV